jgi:EmrB/QacA subfamily drug resistance transporter
MNNRRWWALAAVCAATFMLLVDVTIVQVALPTVQRDFRATFSDLQWVIDAYALVLSSLILTSGALADRFGRKRVFVAGVAIFTAGSFLCGVAGGATALVVSRAAQGVGGAAMFATGLALIGQDFRGPERLKAIALWGATVGGAVAAGPLLGGLITQAISWRWVFFVNVPIGVATVAVSVPLMVNKADPDARRLDVAGLVTFSGSLFLLVLTLVRGNDDGWASGKILALFAAAAALMAAFIIVERRQARPMFDLSLFRGRAFTGVSLATFAIGSGMFASLPYLTFYLQNGLGYSPLAGGLRLLPATLMAFLVPLVVGRAGEKIPSAWLLFAGLALSGTGLLLMAHLSAGSSWTTLLAGLVVCGVGVGLANPAIGRIALSVVPPQRSGMASGISNTFRIAGLATGVAALGALLEHRLASSLGHQLGHTTPALPKQVASEGIRAAAATGQPAHVLLAAYVAGTNEVLFIGGLVVLVGAALALAMVRARDLPAAAPAPVVVALPEAAPQSEAESRLARRSEQLTENSATGPARR